MSFIYETKDIYIEIEKSEIPWLKIFTKKPYKELSSLPLELRLEMYRLLDVIEKEMLVYFQPTKINIASFGNYMPLVHWHIMARFEEDSYFPEAMWGEKQRESSLDFPSMDIFYTHLLEVLKQ